MALTAFCLEFVWSLEQISSEYGVGRGGSEEHWCPSNLTSLSCMDFDVLRRLLRTVPAKVLGETLRSHSGPCSGWKGKYYFSYFDDKGLDDLELILLIGTGKVQLKT